MHSTEKILFVDDDANLLEGCARQLRKRFQLDTARGGAPGLAAVAERGPYAVVVSDLRMPEMDGLQFLAQVKALAPETVRMMLTGYPDLQAAIDAINEGNVFRFLTKPCAPEGLIQALEAGLEEYRRRRSEEQLLAKKLRRALACLEPAGATAPADAGRADGSRALAEVAARFPAPAGPVSEGPGRRCLALAWDHLAEALLELKQITDVLSAPPEAEASLSRAVLLEALRHTIQALADTKHSFKSKEIADVRRRLEALLG
jgi:FixJ family two-component response regulator